MCICVYAYGYIYSCVYVRKMHTWLQMQGAFSGVKQSFRVSEFQSFCQWKVKCFLMWCLGDTIFWVAFFFYQRCTCESWDLIFLCDGLPWFLHFALIHISFPRDVMRTGVMVTLIFNHQVINIPNIVLFCLVFLGSYLSMFRHLFSRNVFAFVIFFPIADAFQAKYDPEGSTWCERQTNRMTNQ